MADNILSILQHALGVDSFGRGEMYRNHFVAGPGHSDFDTCMKATHDGLLAHRENEHVVGGHIFTVTLSGKQYVRECSPRPDRKQRAKDRYSRFLDLREVCPDLTFRDFLRKEKERAYG